MTVLRTDYRPYPYTLAEIDLDFDLDRIQTSVKATFKVSAKPETPTGHPLVLDGQQIDLGPILVDGRRWAHFSLSESRTKLTITDLPRECLVEIHNTCRPADNNALMGLYACGKNLLTQCEPEGFRRICWFADRPDVMSIYRVTLRACRETYPTLLSNGNLIQVQTLPNGRHLSIWEDPFPKPSYLFALVAGRFDCREQTLQTRSARDVLLQIYSDPGTRERTEWAMQSLIRAIRWDESRFNLELDLDRFMIVAAADFNMGAMENKGLNVFNDAYVLADPSTATDTNYRNIEAVIGHEYFHNWTGNRVTCRDWFQLSLKEGLTVFREQEFAADMLASGLDTKRAASARAIKRIDDVTILRNSQFPEDAGPMAHPVRPQSYEEISNFYTATIYEKGAEVIRMIHTLLGEETFQKGLDIYFSRHDGQAITCEDLVAAMETAWRDEAPDRSLAQFQRWYDQAGTPEIQVDIVPTGQPDQVQMTLRQTCPRVGVERHSNADKLPFHIPIAIGAISTEGLPLNLHVTSQQGQTLLLELTEKEQSWIINGWAAQAIPSLLRDFSAPVRMTYAYDSASLHLLAQKDTNAFARWQATQTLLSHVLLSLIGSSSDQQSTELARLAQTLDSILNDQDIDDGYKSRLLHLPSDAYLLQQMSAMDPLGVAKAKTHLAATLGKQLSRQLLGLVHHATPETTFDPGPAAAGQRALTNLALDLLCRSAHPQAATLALTHYNKASNMTAQLGALQALYHHPDAETQRQQASDDFYRQFQDEPLVLDKWFALQASAPTTSVSQIRELLKHPAYNARNPNRIRALVFQFCMNNPLGFHAVDGGGYDFWAQQVCELDANNPEIAARLARVMDHWRDHIPAGRQAMEDALLAVSGQPQLSPNTREVISKALSL